jgi:RHS repeat-associated protein
MIPVRLQHSHLLAELNGLSSNAVLRKYTWGLDLSESLGGAGGIGGLLAVSDPNEGTSGVDLLYTYDALGNVGQLVDLAASGYTVLNGGLKGTYTYTPYGQIKASDGSYRDKNRFRFSTKYFPADADEYIGYWGYRYYHPDLGRWLNRDPIEEAGGVNLYAYVVNTPVRGYDPLGLSNDACLKQCVDDPNDPCPPPPGDMDRERYCLCMARCKTADCKLDAARCLADSANPLGPKEVACIIACGAASAKCGPAAGLCFAICSASCGGVTAIGGTYEVAACMDNLDECRKSVQCGYQRCVGRPCK